MAIYINNFIVITLLMLLGWMLSVYQKNVTIVDSFWGMGFVLIAWLTFLQTDGVWGRQLLLTLLTTIWGVRLFFYLTLRNHGKDEDPRYARWRKKSGERFWLISLFKVFLLQSLLIWVITLSIQAGQMSKVPLQMTVLDLAGTSIWLIGFIFETVGDFQLSRFKSDPLNEGKVLSEGIWRYTRHPNYFGESMIWWGIFLISLSSLGNWWSIISPILVTAVLMKVTGIPFTEESIVETRPDYHDYIRRTSPFFPRRPESSQKEAQVYHDNTHSIGS